MDKTTIVNVDSRGRISLGRLGVKPGQLLRVVSNGVSIRMEPVTEYTRNELETELGYTFTDEQWEAMLDNG